MNNEEFLQSEKYKLINGSSYSALTEGEIKLIYEAMDAYAAERNKVLVEALEDVLSKSFPLPIEGYTAHIPNDLFIKAKEALKQFRQQ